MRYIFILLMLFSVINGGRLFGQQKTFVVVHGAWGGAWSFKKLDSLLSAQNNKVYRVTLTGQGERAHLSSAAIGLKTHITDVVNTILYEELQDIILVGHSYGGMVITGVADSVPDRIRKLVYIDAFVPEDGESVLTARDNGQAAPEDNPRDGFVIPDWLDRSPKPPSDVPQSYKTFSQPVSRKKPAAIALPATYILTVDEGKKPEEDFFYNFSQRAKKRGWRLVQMTADHNPQMSNPSALADLLRKETDYSKGSTQ